MTIRGLTPQSHPLCGASLPLSRFAFDRMISAATVRPMFRWLVLLVLLCMPAVLRAADLSPLLQLVTDDAGLCIEVSNLRDQLPVLEQSNFFQRLQSLDMYREWVEGEEFQHWRAVKQTFERLTGEPLDKTAVDLFGSSVVIAVYPSLDGNTSGVLLTQTAGDESIDRFLDAWNRAEPHKTVEHSHREQPYFSRSRTSDEAPPIFYARLGHVLAMSNSSTTIEKTIDLHLTSVAASRDPIANFVCIADSPQYQKIRDAYSTPLIASVYFNPRRWDGFLDLDSNLSLPHQALCAAWKRTQAIMCGLRFEQGPVFDFVLDYNGEDPGERWNRFLERAQGEPEFLKRVPSDAVFAIAGRHDFADLEPLIRQMLPSSVLSRWSNYRATARGMLFGLDPFNDVLANFEPNWGAYLCPRRSSGDGRAAMDGVVAFQLPPIERDRVGTQQVSLRAALENGLIAGLNLWALYGEDAQHGTSAEVRTETRDGVTIRYLETSGVFRPAFAITDEFLILGSGPELVTEFVGGGTKNRLIDDPKFQAQSAEHFSGHNQLIYANIGALREVLAKNREHYVQRVAEGHGMSNEAAEHKVAHIEDVLGLVDSMFLAGQVEANRIRIVAGCQALESTPAP